MGNQQQYGKSVETFILKHLPQLSYKLSLNDTLMYKTVLCTLEDEGPIVAKFHFSKIEDNRFQNLEAEVENIRKTFNLYRHPNILNYEKIFFPQKKAILGVRMYVCHNLKEKLHRIPKLSKMEKKWLVFQLLCAVSQVHSEKYVHGDIKPSNILITSYNWLFLTDMVPYKPSLLGEGDLKQYNLYFGELDNNQRCYIAPERIVASISIEDQFDKKNLEPSMDIFSAGCVIAEIFMDGHPLFDLASLQNYRKKEYDPREDLHKKIKDPKIVDMIMSMIHRDSFKRHSINDYLLRWSKEIFPSSFSQVYYQLASTFVRPQFMFSDMKISLIRKYINSLWYSCFGKKDATTKEEFYEPIEPFVFEKIREDTIKDFEAHLVPSNELFIFLSKQNLQEMYKIPDESQRPITQEDKDSIIVAVHLIGTLITSCFYPQSRLCGLEMLLKMAKESSFQSRLQFILPYVLQMFEDQNSKVKGKAIEVAVLMFEDVIDKAYLTTLSAQDYKVFDSYILPAFVKLKNESTKDQYVQHIFVRYLPMLAQIGHRFLELSIGSKFQKIQQSKNVGANQASHQSNAGASVDSSSQGLEQSKDVTDSIQSSEDKKENKIQVEGEDSDDDSQRLFSHNENLMASSVQNHMARHRSTVVIKDGRQVKEERSNIDHKHLQDAQLVFVNYDTEYDKLRRIFLSIINDILSETEPTLQRILYENFGNLSIFFGRKMTIDNLIPLSNSCFNKKDFMLRLECLKGIPYLGLRVGQLTFAKFLLITCTQLLYDSEEAVVNEMINTLNKLLEFGLLSKPDSLENMEKLLPFLLHPNTWIKEGAMKFIKNLANPDTKILSKAESYCIIRPKLKLYLRKGEKVYQIYDDLELYKLKPSLSRRVYEYEIKGLPNYLQFGQSNQQKQSYIEQLENEMTETDKEAKLILKEVLLYAKQFHSSFKRDKMMKDVDKEYLDDFRRKIDRARTYRVVLNQVVSQLSGVSFGNTIASLQTNYIQQSQQAQNQKKKSSNESTDKETQQRQIIQQDEDNELDILANDLKEQMNSQEYLDQNFYSVIQTASQDIDRFNYGLNKRYLNNQTGILSFEYDYILQGLNVVPENPELPLILYKNHNIFQYIQAQQLHIGTQLSVEQSSAQPQQIPQFSTKESKNAQIGVNQANAIYYQLGQQKSRFSNWRPSGRLITTLYEHKKAVNSLAITDDSQYFLTGSKLDLMVNIWKTKDIEGDVTSHSAFSIKCKRQVNAVTTIDNSNYFALACSQGFIDIYQMGRAEQEFSGSQFQKMERRQNTTSAMNGRYQSNAEVKSFVMVQGNQEPNHTSIIKTIEKKDEGDITLCTNMILPIQQQHVLAYTTQRGSLYFHDMRSRYDVSSQQELFGSQRGLATCLSIGQDPYQLYFGTVGGYIMIYDVRYNVIASHYKHSSRAPINSVASFNPSPSSYRFNRADHNSPMVLVSSGSSNYEVSLLNLETSDVEILLSVDDKKNKDNIVQTLPQVPSFFREANSFYYEQQELPQSLQGVKRLETNDSLFRRYLMSHKNSQHYLSLISLQQQSLIKNLDEEWLKHSKNRYMLLKTGYESGNACRKIIVPRKYSSLLHNSETVSYAITGGNDRKIRYWDFTGLKSKNFQINTPNDDECLYSTEHAGDTLIVQEKVQQFKQFPHINSQIAAKQIDNLNQNNNNYTPYQNSTYYDILGGLKSGASSFIQGGKTRESSSKGSSVRTQSFQMDRINDVDVICNFNGLSEWQQFNGISMNQGCGIVGGQEVSGSKAGGGVVDYMYRDSQNISHFDSILELGVLELSSQEPILISCGRDGLVKLWR